MTADAEWAKKAYLVVRRSAHYCGTTPDGLLPDALDTGLVELVGFAGVPLTRWTPFALIIGHEEIATTLENHYLQRTHQEGQP